MSLWQDLLTTRSLSARRHPAGWSAFVALVLVTAAGYSRGRIFDGLDRFPPEGHTAVSLDLAIDRALCGTRGLISDAFVPSRYLREHLDRLREPVRNAVESQAGTVAAYCRTVTTPLTNNENSLMFLMRAVFVVQPDASARDIGRWLALTNLGVIGVFGLASLGAGLSPALVAALIVVLVAIAGRLSIYAYSVYPFLLTMPLLFAAACLLTLVSASGRPVAVPLAAGVVLGLVAGFVVNVRSSGLPLVALIALELLWSMFFVTQRLPRRRALLMSIAVGTAIVAGFLVFDVVLVRPLRLVGGSSNYVSHTIAHPLVLGLAVPGTDFTKTEGLSWNDAAGLSIARRVVPNATYLGPTYETALFQYYVGLWRRHPREMAAVYARKVEVTGRGVFLQAAHLLPDWPIRRLFLVFADRATGGWLLLSSLAALACAVWRHARTASAPMLLLAMTATATLLVLIEAAIIYPIFYLAYHSFLLLAVAAAPLLALQAAVDLVATANR